MPRSGTTLTEQIIASHAEVHGGGELQYFLEIAHNLNGFPNNLQYFNMDAMTNWGDEYIRRLAKLGDKLYVTNKMPANYMTLGFIPLALPNVKIIHVKRNPVDTCLSCYTRLFNRH